MEKDAYMLTFSCTNPQCMAIFRIGRIITAPVIKTGAFQYCGICGGRGLAIGNEVDNFWEILSKEYNIPVEGLQLIFTIWNPNEETSFGKFAEKTWKSAANSAR